MARSNSTCAHEECSKPVMARSYCSQHYRRLLAYGDVNRVRRKRVPPRCTADGCPRFASPTTGVCKVHGEEQKPHRETCWRCWEIEFALTTGLGYGWLLSKGIFADRTPLLLHIRTYQPELMDGAVAA